MAFQNITAQQAVKDVENHMGQFGRHYLDWYIGIASDPEKRLFNDHNVKKNGDAWIYRSLSNDAEARRVEQHFISRGCKGGPGGGGVGTKYVYAYRITSSTVE